MQAKIQPRARLCLMISAAIMLVALLLSLFGYGLNLGIDFSGGIIMKYDMHQDFDVNDVGAALDKVPDVNSRQIAKAGEAQTELQVRINDVANSDDVRAQFEEDLKAKYPDMEYISVDRVGAVAGRDLIRNALMSVLVAWLLMMVYIAIRFDLYSGLAAVFGILHDVLVMLSAMVLLRSFVQINSTFIAALLTIVGYSINNTIIIFDRIRENSRLPISRTMSRNELVEHSVKQSLARTINTTLTTLLTTVTLYILGVDAVKEFALPLIIGMVSGVYASNLINGYVWAWLLGRRDAARKAKKA